MSTDSQMLFDMMNLINATKSKKVAKQSTDEGLIGRNDPDCKLPIGPPGLRGTNQGKSPQRNALCPDRPQTGTWSVETKHVKKILQRKKPDDNTCKFGVNCARKNCKFEHPERTHQHDVVAPREQDCTGLQVLNVKTAYNIARIDYCQFIKKYSDEDPDTISIINEIYVSMFNKYNEMSTGTIQPAEILEDINTLKQVMDHYKANYGTGHYTPDPTKTC